MVSNSTIAINDIRNSVNERSCFLLKKEKEFDDSYNAHNIFMKDI